MRYVVKRRDFAKWQTREKLDDVALCRAVGEMESGQVGAELGGLLYKLRIPRPGQGKRGGFRTVLSARIGTRYVFLHGFAKSEKSNISHDERTALQFAGRVLLELSLTGLAKAIESGVLVEVKCEQNH